MPTVAETIYQVARRGTQQNPQGLPPRLASLLVDQSKFETATAVRNHMIPYTSNAFTIDNNAFGYKWVGSRYQVRAGIKSSEGDAYGHYDTYSDSVLEMVDWIYRRVKDGVFPADLDTIRDADQYAALLKKAGFYGAPESVYAAGLKRWYTAQTAGAVGGVILLGATAFAIIRYMKKNKSK